MLTYNQAKALKDCGFPQKKWTKSDLSFLARENGDSQEGPYDSLNDRTMLLNYFSDEYLVVMDIRGLIVYIPTLSELIEACGDGFEILAKSLDGFGARGPKVDTKEWSISSTPEEALCNLYLALNKK